MDPTQARSRVLIDDPAQSDTTRPPQKRERGRFAPEHDPPPDRPTTSLGPRSAPGSVIVGDRLEGASQIALFWFGSDDAHSIRRLYHAVRRNRLPTGKDGGKLIASKAKLLAHWNNQTSSKSNGQGREEETP
jgi:hypothetical protein